MTPVASAGAAPRRVVAAPTLIRAIGRWSLLAAVVNGVVGSSLFGMPSAVAALVGTWGPLAVLFAGACIFVVVLSFAEVGSRFDEAGGPYLYTRDAFGPTIGFHVGWLHIWARLFSGAAVLNVFIAYLALLLPAAGTPTGRAVAMTMAVAIVSAVNVIGVRQAAWVVNALTVAKLLPAVLLIALGAVYFNSAIFLAQSVAAPKWADAVLLLVFAYGGFESSIIAASETIDPRRDTAFALIGGLTAITAIYCFVQLAIMGVLPHTAADPAPFASALALLWPGRGAAVGAIGAVLSAYGWLTGFALMTPRVLYSMGRRGELPATFASVHPAFRTPHVAIVVNSVVALAMALYSSFTGAAALAAIARLGMFALTCASLIVLRRRSAEPAPFTVPGGRFIAVLGVAFTAWLLATRSLAQAWMLAAIIGIGAALQIWARRHPIEEV